jgi:hypothetical protein
MLLRILAILLILAYVPAVQAQVRAKAWAAVQEDGTLVTPESYNSEGGLNTAARIGVGQYVVFYPKLGNTTGGISQISSASPLARCKSEYYKGTGGGVEQAVHCRDFSGADLDSPFTALYYRESRAGTTTWKDAYFYNDQLTPADGYQPPANRRWHSLGAAISLYRSGAGVYQAVLPGMAGPGAIALVTASGTDNTYCSVVDLNSLLGSSIVNLACYSPDGHPADATFQCSYMSDVAVGVNVATDRISGAMAYVTGTVTPPVSVDSFGGGHIRIVHPSTGHYKVDILTVTAGDTSVKAVTAQGDNSCSIGTTHPALINIQVDVDCVDRHGTAADSNFNFLYLTAPPPAQLTLSKTHTGNFAQGGSYDYSLTAGNSGGGPTVGTVTVTDTVPAGLSLLSMGGNGWVCTANSCSRSDELVQGTAYPPISVTVSVAGNATSPQVNSATASGGGSQPVTAQDSTTIVPSSLTVSLTHLGSFVQGQAGAAYTAQVSNTFDQASKTGATLIVPPAVGMTVTSLSGAGWTCTVGTATCTNASLLPTGGSYPPVTVLVSVAANAPAQTAAGAIVTGGWPNPGVSNDPTAILPAATDVAPPDFFYDAVNLMRQYGITGGCQVSPVKYCPNDNVTRAQMAIFIVRAVMGGDNFTYLSVPYFLDVPANAFGFKWIQKMFELGITAGCGAANYCPNDNVTRGQMAVFVIRARLGAAADGSFIYPLSPSFTDAPANYPYFKWIQRMKLDQITGGCGGTSYCPDSPVTRGQMAIFVMRGAFNLLLPNGTAVVSGVSPAILPVGQTTVVSVTGSNTLFTPGVTQVDAGPGVSTGTITVVSPTTLNVSLAVAGNATTGPRTIRAGTGAQDAVLPNGLKVQ